MKQENKKHRRRFQKSKLLFLLFSLKQIYSLLHFCCSCVLDLQCASSASCHLFSILTYIFLVMLHFFFAHKSFYLSSVIFTTFRLQFMIFPILILLCCSCSACRSCGLQKGFNGVASTVPRSTYTWRLSSGCPVKACVNHNA